MEMEGHGRKVYKKEKAGTDRKGDVLAFLLLIALNKAVELLNLIPNVFGAMGVG